MASSVATWSITIPPARSARTAFTAVWPLVQLVLHDHDALAGSQPVEGQRPGGVGVDVRLLEGDGGKLQHDPRREEHRSAHGAREGVGGNDAPLRDAKDAVEGAHVDPLRHLNDQGVEGLDVHGLTSPVERVDEVGLDRILVGHDSRAIANRLGEVHSGATRGGDRGAARDIPRAEPCLDAFCLAQSQRQL